MREPALTRPPDKELADRGALITGASRGIGLAIARAYVTAGAHVAICARSATELARAGRELGNAASPGQVVVWNRADVADPSQAKNLVEAALDQLPSLDILVSNAGVYGPKGRIEDVEWSTWIEAIDINLLGPVALCRAAVPHFRSRGQGKIIQLSGGGATKPMPRFSAYAASKAAVVRFMESLAGEVADSGIEVNSLGPGGVNTRMLDELLDAGRQAVGDEAYDAALLQREEGGESPERAARLAVFLGSARSNGITGKLISSKWDDWDALADLPPDAYTLRRLLPEHLDRP